MCLNPMLIWLLGFITARKVFYTWIVTTNSSKWNPDKHIFCKQRYCVIIIWLESTMGRLPRQLLWCASVFIKWISWFRIQSMYGNNKPQIQGGRWVGVSGDESWERWRFKEENRGNHVRVLTPRWETLPTSWQSGEKRGMDGWIEGRESEREVEGQPQPHVKCGTDIWTAPSLFLLFSLCS